MSEYKQPTTVQTHILELAKENLRQIASHLSNKDFVAFTNTCRKLRDMAMSSTIYDRKRFEGEPLQIWSFNPVQHIPTVPLIRTRGVGFHVEFGDDLIPILENAEFVTGLWLKGISWDDASVHKLLFTPPAQCTSTTKARAECTADSTDGDSDRVSNDSNSHHCDTNGHDSDSDSDNDDDRENSDHNGKGNKSAAGLEPRFPCLSHLTLDDCKRMTACPNVPTLRRLVIAYCDELTTLPQQLPKLTRLELYDCPRLKPISPIPTLVELYLRSCQKLAELPPLPRLKDLRVTMFNPVVLPENLPCLRTLDLDECAFYEIPAYPNLSSLELRACYRLWSLPDDLPCLTDLSISCCQRITAIPAYPMLQQLSIVACFHIRSIPRLNSLTGLWLSDDLRDLESLGNFPRLQHLEMLCHVKMPWKRLRRLTDLSCYDEHLSQLPEMPKLRALRVHELKLESMQTFAPHLKQVPHLVVRSSRCDSFADLEPPATLSFKLCDEVCFISNMAAVTSLTVYRCKSITSISDMPALVTLEVSDCDAFTTAARLPKLKSLSFDAKQYKDIWRRRLSSDKTLHLVDCPALTTLENKMRTLETLHIKGTTREPKVTPIYCCKVIRGSELSDATS